MQIKAFVNTPRLSIQTKAAAASEIAAQEEEEEEDA